MNTPKSKLMALLTAVTLVAPMAATAQQGQRAPEPPFAEMAQALGVSEQAVKSCFQGPEKSKDKGNSKTRPERPDAAKIATCLKAENNAITKAKVEKTLSDFAPSKPRG